jgi:hypothetical protein
VWRVSFSQEGEALALKSMEQVYQANLISVSGFLFVVCGTHYMDAVDQSLPAV